MANMSADQVMLNFQHKMLPTWFYDDPKQFVGVVSMEKTALFEIVSELFRRAGVENPYNAGQFGADYAEVSKNVGVLNVRFPNAENAPLCHSAMCFFDKNFKYTSYYTVEKGDDTREKFPVLGIWAKNDDKLEHINLGMASLDPDERMMECIDMFMGKYADDLEKEYGKQVEE